MRLALRDPSYTERLASFLASVGQSSTVAAPDRVEVTAAGDEARLELELYLRVWHVLYPDAEVELAA